MYVLLVRMVSVMYCVVFSFKQNHLKRLTHSCVTGAYNLMHMGSDSKVTLTHWFNGKK